MKHSRTNFSLYPTKQSRAELWAHVRRPRQRIHSVSHTSITGLSSAFMPLRWSSHHPYHLVHQIYHRSHFNEPSSLFSQYAQQSKTKRKEALPVGTKRHQNLQKLTLELHRTDECPAGNTFPAGHHLQSKNHPQAPLQRNPHRRCLLQEKPSRDPPTKPKSRAAEIQSSLCKLPYLRTKALTHTARC